MPPNVGVAAVMHQVLWASQLVDDTVNETVHWHATPVLAANHDVPSQQIVREVRPCPQSRGEGRL